MDQNKEMTNWEFIKSIMDNKKVLATFLAITLDNCNQNYQEVLEEQYKWLDDKTEMSVEEFEDFWNCIMPNRTTDE